MFHSVQTASSVTRYFVLQNWIVVSVFLGQSVPDLLAQSNDTDQAGALVQSIEAAYRNVRTFELEQDLLIMGTDTPTIRRGGWRRRLLFHREGDSFRLDDWYSDSIVPTVTTVSNGRKMWHRDLRSGPHNRAVESVISIPKDYYSLVTDVPALRGDWSPILALLMGEGLSSQVQFSLSEPDRLNVERLQPQSDEPGGLIGLKFSGWGEPLKSGFGAALVFRVNPRRFWIERVEIQNHSGVVTRVLKSLTQSDSPSFGHDVFRFDSRGLTIVDSYRKQYTPVSSGSLPIVTPVSMVGKIAPSIRLKTLTSTEYDLDRDPARVIVVDFAKWDRGQLQRASWLPKLQKWIENSGKSVSLQAISSGQSEEFMQRLWEKHGLSVSVLMDRDEAVKKAYNVSLPRRFIIHQGKVVYEDFMDYGEAVAFLEALLRQSARGEATTRSDSSALKMATKATAITVEASKIGTPAPIIRLKTMDGRDYDLALDRSEVVVIDFWTTWCGSCRKVLPEWQKFHDWIQMTGKPVSLFAINCAQTEEMVQRLWKEMSLSVPVLMDKDRAVTDAYHVAALPRNFIIHQGKVVQQDLPVTLETLVRAVESLLTKGNGKP